MHQDGSRQSGIALNCWPLCMKKDAATTINLTTPTNTPSTYN